MSGMCNICIVSKYCQENYVPLSNFEAKMQKPEFDVIVAFRITKYIQLNHGDDGLKRTFVKIFNHLKPGGKLYLQAQDWQSYKEKRKLTVSIKSIYNGLRDVFAFLMLNIYRPHFKCSFLYILNHSMPINLN